MTGQPTVSTATARPLPETRLARPVFSAAVFTAAALLFMVQPLVARMILPELGGSPVVWIIAVAFFQVTLLAGYGYAHLAARLGPRARAVAHGVIVIVALATLPLAIPAWTPPSSEPYLWLVGLLAVVVGAPFFVLAASSPGLAHWYTDGGRRDPYFLYSVSNAGSFVGLLSYPLVIEPVLGLGDQSILWAGAFAAFAVLAAVAISIAARSAGSAVAPAEPVHGAAIPWGLRLSWIGLAFVPSSLLLGSTTYITSEVGSVPLLWVLPLAAYLLTFVIAFRDRARPIGSWPARAATLLVFAAITSWSIQSSRELWLDLALHVGLLFTAGLVVHLRLYRSRPEPARLTEFYLLISLGGALGGIFNAFIAPVVFDWAVEYPLVIIAAVGLLGSRTTQSLRSARVWAPAVAAGAVALVLAVAADGAARHPATVLNTVAIAAGAVLLLSAKRAAVLAVGVALLVALFPPVSNNAIYRERTFFGVLSVRQSETERSMYHGTTLHGTQFLDDRALQPAAYYAEPGPLGDVFATRHFPANIAVVGLGVGTIATYGHPGDHITFFEIDAAVVHLAEDPELFTFLKSTAAEVAIEVEDGRIGLEASPPGTYDLIVLDAFSADAIPVHLVTREAIAGYLDRLVPGGRLAIHISNRFFDLRPVLAAAADELDATALTRFDGGGEERFASRWVVMSVETAAVDVLRELPDWEPLMADPSFRLWTDDYSNPLAVLR